ncbi:hypothetical protein U1Q18_012746, partial [Sarracenia purpurea var. burkii]
MKTPSTHVTRVTGVVFVIWVSLISPPYHQAIPISLLPIFRTEPFRSSELYRNLSPILVWCFLLRFGTAAGCRSPSAADLVSICPSSGNLSRSIRVVRPVMAWEDQYNLGRASREKNTVSSSNTTIFVDNLPEEIHSQWLCRIFQQCGYVQEVFIPTKRRWRSKTRYGFVKFLNDSDA